MAKYNDLASFKEYELFPALFNNINTAFPELSFKFTSGRWESKYHLDGCQDSQNKGITFVYPNSKYMAIDHATGEKKGLIDLYMNLNSIDFHSALNDLAKLCSLTPPAQDSGEWEYYEEQQRNREEANETFKNALFGDSEEAQRVRAYLIGRNWTEAEIKKAELGLITTAIRSSLPDGESYRVGGVGTTHLLTIPYRNGGRLLGFKFREVVETSTGTKYLNSYGLNKSAGLFGIGIGVNDVVIVEGELDALHAKVLGADNVVATTGNHATETQIRDAYKRGVKKFTLLFDNDKKGRSFIKPTIEAIQSVGGSIYVASLPEGYKDLDEYLVSYSIEDYKRDIVGRAVNYSTFILNDIVERYEAKRMEDTLSHKDREDFFDEVERLLNSRYTKPQDREQLYKQLEQHEEKLNFKVADIRSYLDKAYYREQEKHRETEVRETSLKIQEAVEAGRTTEALTLMRETTAKQRAEESSVEYAKVFATSTPEEYATFLSETKEGIPTGFIFKQGRKEEQQEEELTLNAGLTFICGYRGHGKTSFLNNIALNDVKRNLALGNGKSVLYFSYEVDKRRLMADLLNTFINDAGISHNPIKTINSYFKGSGNQYFSPDRRENGVTHYENFLQQKDIFLRDYLSSGALTIVEENYRVEKLLEAIKYYLSIRNVSIVCIDYAQLLYSEDYSRQRTEEIKKIVNDIKDFANKEGIPFVLACQFNREVDSPVNVDTKNIGEGGDFERIADTCIGLFNLKELRPLREKELSKVTKSLIESLGVATYLPQDELKPIQGKLFARLMKRRNGYFPLDIVLDWEGKTKYIKPNFEEALLRKEGELYIPDFADLETTEEEEEEDFL